MFLKSLVAKNPRFLESVVQLHQAGRILPNSYVIDLDALQHNTRHLMAEAKQHDLAVYAMTKQLGRAPGALDAITAGGADGFVAVDMDCARPIIANGHRFWPKPPKCPAGMRSRCKSTLPALRLRQFYNFWPMLVPPKWSQDTA